MARSRAAAARCWLRASVGPELPGAPADVEVLRRHGEDGRSWLFVFNHGTATADVPATGCEMLAGAQVVGSLRLAPGAVVVFREESVC